MNSLKTSILFLLPAVFIMAVSVVFTRAAPPSKVLLEKADECRRALYRSAKKRKYRHHWMRCIDRYKKVYGSYPRSEQAPWAMYRAGRMLSKLYGYSGREADLNEALGLFKGLVERYENHRIADDAQYRIGEITYHHKKDPTQAYVEFLKVDIKFPSGDMRPKAREMMDKLSVILAKKEAKSPEKKMKTSVGKLTLVKDIRHWSTPTYTRVVIDLERPVKYVSDLLKEDPGKKKPERLYVDLLKTYVGEDIESSIPIRDGLLQRARAAQHSTDSVRVVLDINSIGGYKIFHLHDPYRVVVDVRSKDPGHRKLVTKTAVKNRPVRKGIRKPKKADESVSLARQLGLSVRKIVIDPGHGGRDPGCYLKGGIKEKAIVLKIAKLLAKKIEERLGCDVILTRNRDAYISLEKRTALANVEKADLFISLHINAHKQRSIKGLETYFLNMATDERAVMVAARENATSQKNISDLQTILNDLMLNTKISESSKLAHEVQNGMVNRMKNRYKVVKSLGVKQAPFYVLIGAEMPAILIETGFITNPTDRKRLLSTRYHETLADGIVAGIDSYIKSIDKVYQGG